MVSFSVNQALVSAVDRLLGQLLSQHCLLCGQRCPDAPVCAGCHQDLPWLRSVCEQCGRPRPAGSLPRCLRCTPLLRAFDRTRSALAYEYPVDRLIMAAKFGHQIAVARALGDLLAMAGLDGETGHGRRPALLPVPLHWRRHAQRGFNQSGEIARAVSLRTGWPVITRSCRRTRPTAEQAGLGAAARRRNVRGAFAVTREVAATEVIVIDDVLTTGATAAAVGEALRSAGVQHLQLWTVARVARRAS